ncbi:MAG: hypothetical protein WBQ46_17470 [Terriglobales bacterium]
MSDQHLFENISEDWVKELEALDTRVTELIGETSLSPKNKKELQERVHQVIVTYSPGNTPKPEDDEEKA